MEIMNFQDMLKIGRATISLKKEKIKISQMAIVNEV